MADLLSESLMGLNVPASENAWGIGASTLGSIAPKLINPYGNVGTNLGVGLGSVLLTALLGYQAKQTAAEESLTTSKLANQLMGLQTPEQRTALIESAGGDLTPRLTSRLLQFNTALTSQEKANALDIAKAKGLEEAKLQVALSPLGTEAFKRQLEQMRAQQDAIFGRQSALEDIKQAGRMTLKDKQIKANDDLMRAKAKISEASKAGTLNTKQSNTVQGAIEFGNAAEDFIQKLDLENMSYATFQAKMKDPALFGVDLTAELETLKAPYRLSNAGTAASASEMKNVDKAFGITNWSSPEELIAALRGLKEARAKAADSAIATASMKVPDLYKGIQTLRAPGERFSFEPLNQRFSDIENAFNENRPSTDVAPNTVPTTPTPAAVPTIDPAVLAEARAIIDDPNIPESAKTNLRAMVGG